MEDLALVRYVKIRFSGEAFGTAIATECMRMREIDKVEHKNMHRLSACMVSTAAYLPTDIELSIDILVQASKTCNPLRSCLKHVQ